MSSAGAKTNNEPGVLLERKLPHRPMYGSAHRQPTPTCSRGIIVARKYQNNYVHFSPVQDSLRHFQRATFGGLTNLLTCRESRKEGVSKRKDIGEIFMANEDASYGY